ncbi:MAG: response regulator transcription factor [Solirubrobacteraceae bacterium]
MSQIPSTIESPHAGAQAVVRLVLVDRDALARRAMREAITAAGEFVVSAEAAGEDDAIAAVRSARPDLVLIDIGYPRLEGIAVGKELRRQLPAIRMVFCSITDDEDTAIRALRAGAVGYVRKDLDYGPLARALRGALAGEAAISRQLGTRLIDELYRQAEPHTRLRPAGGALTGREWEVLDLLIDGAGTAEIAQRLGLALETVRSHVKHVLRKLGVGTRGEAIDIARRLRSRSF